MVALAGNPNVGKSTLFNMLTGMRQHTGNWPGKTVEQARGEYTEAGERYTLVDLPGTYSLWGVSPEEEIAGNFLRSGCADVTVVMADATSLQRSLTLALQVRQMTPRMVLCVNLIDEAAKKGIAVDVEKLRRRLAAPVVTTAARSGRGLAELRAAVGSLAQQKQRGGGDGGAQQGEQECQTVSTAAGETWDHWQIRYDVAVERALQRLTPHVTRGEALELLLGREECRAGRLREAVARGQEILKEEGLTGAALLDSVAASVIHQAEEIGADCTAQRQTKRGDWDRRLDHWLTSGITAPLSMLLLLALVLYITVRGANYPSQLLSRGLMALRMPLQQALATLGCPLWLQGMLVEGAYTTVAWVVSVMLPPMAIFFPLFTILEDAGYLPRVAFNLDRLFAAAGAHGRQSLTMCMALGCNACGVTGCRIIDSPRERLSAILTNSFVPCNGRFPTLLALISLFAAPGKPLLASLLLALCMAASLGMTLLASRFLSSTLLKGEASSFSLELPPYRRPQIGRVLIRSLRDRTAFVLGRAVMVAAPAGVLVWGMTHVMIGGETLLQQAADFLQPLGSLMGLDGMILLAFLLGFPANEIVVPILLMGYLSSGTMIEYESLAQLGGILTANGWTGLTALCTVVLCLWHFPCGTTCLTIRKETGSWKWTALGFVLPTAAGMAVCILLRGAAALLSWI